MLVVGTASPAESDSHTGVYLRNQEISRLVQSGALIDLPVKIEHTGHVGWKNRVGVAA